MAAKTRDAEIVQFRPTGPDLPSMTMPEVAGERHRALAQASAARQAAKVARAKGDVEAIKRFVQEMREAERRQLDLAIEIGRRVELPGQGARTDRAQVPAGAECPDGKGSLEQLAQDVGVHPRTIYKFHVLSRVQEDHTAALEAEVEARLERGLALSINELVNKLGALLPKPKAREARQRPSVDRARRAAGAFVRQLEAIAGEDVSAHDIRFLSSLIEAEVERLLPTDRQLNPLERAELLLLAVADHLESAVLPKLGGTPTRGHAPSCTCDSCNSGALMSMEGVVDRLREDASEIERVREGVIAPRDVRDTSYAKPYRIPKPREDR